MAIIIPADLSGLGVAYPKLSEFIPQVPVSGLVEIWRSAVNVTIDGGVSSWRGFNGSVAVQTDPAARPAYSDGLVKPNGELDALDTNIAPPSGGSGYIVAKITKKSDPSEVGVVFGSLSDSSNRIALGYDASGRFGGSVGSIDFSSLRSDEISTNDLEYVIGLYWSGGAASLRVDGVEVDADAYTGTVGTALLDICGQGGASLSVRNSPSWVHSVAVYAGTFTGLDLDAIDTAMAAF